MIKKLLFLPILFLSFTTIAQNLQISGKVVDEKAQSPLPGAHITLMYPWEEAVKSSITDADGTFILEGLEKGGYKLKVSFFRICRLYARSDLS